LIAVVGVDVAERNGAAQRELPTENIRDGRAFSPQRKEFIRCDFNCEGQILGAEQADVANEGIANECLVGSKGDRRSPEMVAILISDLKIPFVARDETVSDTMLSL